MILKLEEIPKQRVAYLRQVGPYGAQNKELMQNLKNWAATNNLFNATTAIYGIAHDNPATTPPENCRYDVCIVLPNNFVITAADINETELAGGQYAIFTIEHTAEAMQKAWLEIRPELASRGYCFDSTKPVMERYIASMVSKHQCEICVPVLIAAPSGI